MYLNSGTEEGRAFKVFVEPGGRAPAFFVRRTQCKHDAICFRKLPRVPLIHLTPPCVWADGTHSAGGSGSFEWLNWAQHSIYLRCAFIILFYFLIDVIEAVILYWFPTLFRRYRPWAVSSESSCGNVALFPPVSKAAVSSLVYGILQILLPWRNKCEGNMMSFHFSRTASPDWTVTLSPDVFWALSLTPPIFLWLYLTRRHKRLWKTLTRWKNR